MAASSTDRCCGCRGIRLFRKLEAVHVAVNDAIRNSQGAGRSVGWASEEWVLCTAVGV